MLLQVSWQNKSWDCGMGQTTKCPFGRDPRQMVQRNQVLTHLSSRLLARPVETEAHSTALTLLHHLSFEVLGTPQGEVREVTKFYSSSLFLFKWLPLSLVANRAEHHISSSFPFMSLLSLEGYRFSGSHPVPLPSQKQKY